MPVQDLTPRSFIIIPANERILIFDPQSDPSLGLGAQIGGLGGRSAQTVSEVINSDGTIEASVLSGTIPQANLNLANRGWTQTCVFSATDLDTVAWATGTLVSADGTTYNIGAGNTGNMAARTFIYLDIAVSTTAYQVTTTASTAVGAGKVLVATAINGTVEPTWEVFGGIGGLNIPGTSIVAASITTSEIAANTIAAGNMNVGQLSAIAADLGTITAGSIYSGLFSTGTAVDTGQRIILNTTDDTLRYYNADNEMLMSVGVAGLYTSSILRTGTTSIALSVSDRDALDINTVSLAEFQVLGTSSTGVAIAAGHYGLGNTAYFFTYSNASRTEATVKIGNSSGQGAHLNLIPFATAPQTPAEGDIYTDTDHFIYYHDGTALRPFVLSGNTQTIAGEKTFSTFPITPSAPPDADYEVSNKKFVDDSVTTAEGLAGEKIATFYTDVTVANTNVETTLLTTTIPGGTLGTNNAIRVIIRFSDFDQSNGVNSGINIDLYYGGTRIASSTIARPATSVTGLQGNAIGYIVATGATNSQEGSFSTTFILPAIDNSDAVTLRFGSQGDYIATIDSTADQTLLATAKWGAASANNSITMEYAIVEKIR